MSIEDGKDDGEKQDGFEGERKPSPAELEDLRKQLRDEEESGSGKPN